MTFTGDKFDDMFVFQPEAIFHWNIFVMLIDVTIFVQYFVNIVIAIPGRNIGMIAATCVMFVFRAEAIFCVSQTFSASKQIQQIQITPILKLLRASSKVKW